METATMETQAIQITDSLGTFTATEPDTIPATLRKRKKEHERAERERFQQYETARGVAMVRGFHVLTMLREPNRAKRGAAELQNVELETFPVSKVEPKPGAFASYAIETDNGSAVVSFHCMESIVSAVLDCNGYPWLLFTLDHFTDSETVRAYTIGVCGSVHCLQLIPNVLPSDFEEPQT
jgi:hypothetical protein